MHIQLCTRANACIWKFGTIENSKSRTSMFLRFLFRFYFFFLVSFDRRSNMTDRFTVCTGCSWKFRSRSISAEKQSGQSSLFAPSRSICSDSVTGECSSSANNVSGAVLFRRSHFLILCLSSRWTDRNASFLPELFLLPYTLRIFIKESLIVYAFVEQFMENIVS